MSVRAEPSWDRIFEEAALDPLQWLTVLAKLAEETGSARAELIGAGAGPASNFSWVSSIDERTMQDFFASGGHSPATNFRIAADDGKSVLVIADERRYDKVKPGLVSDDFVDFCEQYGMVHGCQTVLLREPDQLIGLSLLRTRREGRTGEREQRAFANAARAAARAVRLQRAVDGQGCHLLAGTFEAMDVPCVLIGGSGFVSAVTTAAEHFLADNDSLLVTNSQLRARDPAFDRELASAIRAAVAGQPARSARLFAGRSNSAPTIIEIFPLTKAVWSLPFALAAIAVFRSPGRLPLNAAERLVAAFDLTPAEAEVTVMLCQAMQRAEIATRRSVSPETLRSQLRAIYSKTGCNREAELVLLARTVLE